MAERTGTIIEFPRGRHIGHRVHFYQCPACGGWMDGRDLGQVFDHEGPLPHPADDWRQRDLVAR
jgi:Zn-finger nucleic acid-binding protein